MSTPRPALAVRTAPEAVRLGVLLLVLAAGITAVSVLGPLVTDTLVHRTSASGLNQVTGGDLGALVLAVPATLVAAALCLRGHPAGPVVALAPGLWAIYLYGQLIVGQEYLDLPGNVERFFPLLLGLFVLGGAIVVLAWGMVDADRLPAPSRRLERTAGVVLLTVAAFLVVGLHLPTLVDALRDQPTRVEYTTSPTAFWVVKLMDLGVIVPAAIAIGVGLLRHVAGARKAVFALLGAYTLLAGAVAGMAAVMVANDDPDGSVAFVVAFTVFTAALGALTVALLRPLFRPTGVGAPASVVSARPRSRPRQRA